MKHIFLLGLVFVAISAPAAGTEVSTDATSTPQPILGEGDGIDHVLIWTREIEEDTQVMKDKLGFQVVPGGSFPGNVANRLALFADETYLELLHYTVPLSELDDTTLGANVFLRERDGSIGFGIRTSDLDQSAARLSANGAALDGPTPGSYDPDGPDGPKPSTDSMFRTFGFKASPLPGLEPFFVWYAPFPKDAASRARSQARSTHPNTAKRVTAVWLLTEKPRESRAALLGMGFAVDREFDMRQIAARATVLTHARIAIVLVEPAAVGRAADALRLRGSHVLGVSVEVSDLVAAQRIVEAGYGKPMKPYVGGFGQSILAPSDAELGVLVEFHAAD